MKRNLIIGLAALLIVIVVITAGLSFQGQKPAEQGPYVQKAGDYLEWSTCYYLNATLIDTDHWNSTSLFYLNNSIELERVLLVEQNETNVTLIFSSLDWRRLNEIGIQLAYQGIFPPLNRIENVVWDNGTKWYAPCPDPQIFDPNYTFAELPNQSILTNWGHLYCEHYSLTYGWTQPGIPGVIPDRNCTQEIEWWIYHGILIKMYMWGATEDVPDENVMWFRFLTDTNIPIITENKNV